MSRLIKILKKYPNFYNLALRCHLGLINYYFIRIYLRNKYARSYYKNQLKNIKYWSLKKTENDNFYYDIEDKNLEDLIYLATSVLNVEYKIVEKYAFEIRNDSNLKQHIKSLLEKNRNLKDTQVEFGRRIGWYIFIRVKKPKLVVETGVHHGVGACVVTTALMRNELEGFNGKYIGTEIDGKAGRLFTAPYRNYGEIIYGDSIKTLTNIKDEIDIFINDSDHNQLYEYQEYQVIKSKLTKSFIILGDNCHVSSSLHNFARINKYKYIFFSEKPKNHWYPGAGIGICVPRIPL